MPSHDRETTTPAGGTADWLDSLELIFQTVLKDKDPGQAAMLLAGLAERLRAAGMTVPRLVTTPYLNTIPPEEEPEYPGNREIERRISVCWRTAAAFPATAIRSR